MSTHRRVRAVVRPALAGAFALASLDAEVAEDAPRAVERLKALAADPKTGIVLVDEVLYRALPSELKARFDRAALPVVAPFPAPSWDEKEAAEEYVLGLLRAAIGYRVRAR